MIHTVPTLKNLPQPPPENTGWPWTEQSELLSERMPDGSKWPRISIVTPSYNYGQFLEETIRSVLLQGYPNLEYIIIDGGSTDNTVEVIQKYEMYITYWVSEPDKGQTDAINKGYKYCTGDIFAWLNADDAYANSLILQDVSKIYSHGYEFIVGECIYVNLTQDRSSIDGFNGKSTPTNFAKYLKFWSLKFLPQPSVFITKDVANKCFPLDITLCWVMDYQFFLRALSQKPKSTWVNNIWVKAKLHGDNKTMSSNTGELTEFYQVALAESSKLLYIWQKIFRIDLEDYISLRFALSKEQFSTPRQVVSLLAARPTLVRWMIFWKFLFKSVVGTKIYSMLKFFAHRP